MGPDVPPYSPIYESLTTNLPHPIMAFTAFSFPPSTYLYPKAAAVQEYLKAYTEHYDLRQFIHLNSRVSNTVWDPQSNRWIIDIERESAKYEFDYLIVANGHYRIPLYPDTPGLSDWLSRGKVSHAAWYKRPHDLGDTVMVVGAGPSGIDISTEMCTAAKVVFTSRTGAMKSDFPGPTCTVKSRGRVTSFGDPSIGIVSFEDGTIETNIDHCVLATGYELSLGFLPPAMLERSIPPLGPPLPSNAFNSRYHIYPAAKHMFLLQSQFPPDRLAFLGLPVKVIPFPLIEAQMKVVINVFSGSRPLDYSAEAIDIVTREQKLRSKVWDDPKAVAKAWHRFERDEQFEYRDALCAFASDPWRVREWELIIYGKKDILRAAWREVEARGEADAWVRDLGKGGEDEWVEMMFKLLKQAEGEKHRL